MEDELLTRAEVAEFLKVSQQEVYRLTRTGELPVIKKSKKFVRYKKSDILAFLERYYRHRKERDDKTGITQNEAGSPQEAD
jgi:excisionase family DNA binding protein